jgi:glycosyltransferase involved in cell wall biosynthesis
MYPNSFKFTWHHISTHFPSAVSFHTLWGGSKINHLFALGLMLSADKIIATNSEIIYLLKKHFPFFLSKTLRIPIGANIELSDDKGNYQAIANKYFSDTHRFSLVFFGMSYPGKGMNLLFETMALLLERYQLDIQLLMVGGGISDLPEYVEEKKRLSSILGIEDKVVWTGRIPAAEVSVLLDGCDAVILPFEAGVSDRRGSLMAALAHHKPVVTTKPAIPMALFKNGQNMIWAEKNDAISLAKKISNILTNHDLRKKVENGAAELYQNFQWPEIARQYRDCFRKILNKKNTHPCESLS